MNFDLLINSKHKSKKNIMQKIFNIIDNKNIEIDAIDLNSTLNDFILTYIKLKKFIADEKNNIENKIIVETLIDEMVHKIESEQLVCSQLNKKIIEIDKKINKNKKKNILILKLKK